MIIWKSEKIIIIQIQDKRKLKVKNNLNILEPWSYSTCSPLNVSLQFVGAKQVLINTKS